MGASRVALAAFLSLSAASCSFGKSSETVFPDREWRERDPRALGLDPRRLDDLAEWLDGWGMVVVDGYVVKSWGFVDRRTDWYSSAKPVFATLLLFAAEEGRVASLDARVAEFDWELRPEDREMTLWQLANMTSGYARPDPPGQAWAYNDYGVALFQRTLFDRIYREDPSAVLNHPRRLGALGFEDEPRFSQRRRRLRASARDFARIAWFWLHRGRWEGRELVAAERFTAAFRPHVPSDLPHGQRGRRDDYLGVESFGGTADHFTQAGPGTYGWFWWFNEAGRIHPRARLWPSAPPDTVMSIGGRGNCAALFPSRNAVVVAARAHWGYLEPGRAGGQLDRTLALAAEALRREGARGTAAGPATSQQP